MPFYIGMLVFDLTLLFEIGKNKSNFFKIIFKTINIKCMYNQ